MCGCVQKAAKAGEGAGAATCQHTGAGLLVRQGSSGMTSQSEMTETDEEQRNEELFGTPRLGMAPHGSESGG